MAAPNAPADSSGSQDAPGLDTDQITSIAQFKTVAGAALNAGAAESWTQLGTALEGAIGNLDRFQQGFNSDVRTLSLAFQGFAGDHFQNFANDSILKRSRAVSTAVAGYPRAANEIASSITFFQAKAAEIEAEFADRVNTILQRVVHAMVLFAIIGVPIDGGGLMRAAIKADVDRTVLPELRRALIDLSASYQGNGGGMLEFDARAMQPPKGSIKNKKGSGDSAELTPDPGTAAGAPQPSPAEKARREALMEARDAADKAIGDELAKTPPKGTSPEVDARRRALEEARRAVRDAFDRAINEPTDELKDPRGEGSRADDKDAAAVARKRALEEAKKIVDDAIGKVQKPEAPTGAADSASASGGTAGSATSDPKDEGKERTDAERKKAFEDAKKAADDAIGKLGDGTGSGVPGTGGLDEPTKEEAARHKALEDAKKAAKDAVDDLQKGSSGSGDPSGDKGGTGDPTSGAPEDKGAESKTDTGRQQALDDAKKAANDAIDALEGGGQAGSAGGGEPPTTGGPASSGSTMDPVRRQALTESRKAVLEAITALQKGADPVRRQALEDAKNAIAKAFDGLLAADADSSEELTPVRSGGQPANVPSESGGPHEGGKPPSATSGGEQPPTAGVDIAPPSKVPATAGADVAPPPKVAPTGAMDGGPKPKAAQPSGVDAARRAGDRPSQLPERLVSPGARAQSPADISPRSQLPPQSQPMPAPQVPQPATGAVASSGRPGGSNSPLSSFLSGTPAVTEGPVPSRVAPTADAAPAPARSQPVQLSGSGGPASSPASLRTSGGTGHAPERQRERSTWLRGDQDDWLEDGEEDLADSRLGTN